MVILNKYLKYSSFSSMLCKYSINAWDLYGLDFDTILILGEVKSLAKKQINLKQNDAIFSKGTLISMIYNRVFILSIMTEG